MSGLDFAAVIDDVAGWGDENLRQVESCMVDLGETEGDVAD